MSTRSVTNIYGGFDWDLDDVVCSFYRHSDGYPAGHCSDLVEWLTGKQIKNGTGAGFNQETDFNGLGSMSIQLMAHIDKLTSLVSVIPTGSGSEEFNYNVKWVVGANDFQIDIEGHDKKYSFMCKEFDSATAEAHFYGDQE